MYSISLLPPVGCPAGTYSLAGQSSCTPCAAGTSSTPFSSACQRYIDILSLFLIIIILIIIIIIVLLIAIIISQKPDVALATPQAMEAPVLYAPQAHSGNQITHLIETHSTKTHPFWC